MDRLTTLSLALAVLTGLITAIAGFPRWTSLVGGAVVAALTITALHFLRRT